MIVDKIWIAAVFVWFSIVIVALAMAMLHFRKKKTPTDYYHLYVLGLIFAIMGIAMDNYGLGGFGFLTCLYSVLHRKEWKKNKGNWRKASKAEFKTTINILVLIVILIIAWVMTYFSVVA
jgi:hypothetical protein